VEKDDRLARAAIPRSVVVEANAADIYEFTAHE
jgi:hypothetical protein